MGNFYLLLSYIYCSSIFQLLSPASDGWGKVMSSVCSPSRGGGTPVPGSFQCLWSQAFSGGTPVRGTFHGLWSQVLSAMTGVRPPPARTGVSPGQDWGVPWPGLGYPPSQDWGTPPDRFRCGWYASWGFPQEDFPAMWFTWQMLMIAFRISVRTEEYALIQDETVLSVTALVLDTKAMSVLMVSHAYYMHTNHLNR